MNNLVFLNIFRFVALFLLQIFVFNNINYVGYINPYVFLMFVLLLPFETPWWMLLISSFALGLSIDIFTGSLGIHAAATTAAAFSRPTLIRFLLPKLDKNSAVTPGIGFMGIPTFSLYTFLFVFIHHFLFFFIETLRFSEFGHVLLRTIISSIFSTLFIVLFEFIFRKKRS